MYLSPEHISCAERKLRRQKTQQSAKLGIIWFTWKSGDQTSPWRQSKAITTAMWDAKICYQTKGIPSLHMGYRVTRSCHAVEQWLPGLTTSRLRKAATDAGCLLPQELIQPGEWSLSGEQTSARLTLYIYPIGYIYARLSRITPEVCFTGLSKQKEQNQKPNQPKTQKHPTSPYLHSKLSDS